MMKRYMDDTRIFLPPFKLGWRMVAGSLCYSRGWELEDAMKNQSGEQRTKEILLQIMNQVEDYLTFTAEIGEEFEGGWLPTLDMKLKVTNKNEIVFQQYEKEVSSKQTVQKNSAMGENTKFQILSQDMVRRLLNTSEALGAETREQVVDDYAQKLINSGYSTEQTQRIVLNGIRGYENKKRRRKEGGRELRLTAEKSRGKRHRDKLLSKTTWFRKTRSSTGSSSKTSSKVKREGAEGATDGIQDSTLYREFGGRRANENVCKTCNEGAGEKKELATVKEGSIYIGETSRSIFERSKEHWKDFQGRSDKSHILRHQGASHPGEQPEFIMRTVKYYRTALSRQIGEAVRIAKRGGEGAILNSKSEFERCHIPRLVLEEEEDEEEMEKKEEQRVREEQERIEIQARSWGAKAYKERKEDDRKTWEQEEKVGAKTRRAEDAPKEQRKRKRRRKLPLLGEKEEPGVVIPDSCI